MRMKLLRVCNNKERYYCMDIQPTLFGDYCFERVYGSCKNKKPTGIKKEFFNDIESALKSFSVILKAKLSKGYETK